MTHKIFILQEGDQLRQLEEAPFESEDVLQSLLARHPELLAGDQMNRDQPRRWLLIRRELAVPDREAGGGRWSLDHLFVDQDGVPTLVEVKRAGDTRLRREVVGQLLDYAANGLAYWPAESLRVYFEADSAQRGLDPTQRLEELLGAEGGEPEEFWEQVKTNLLVGRIRLVFLADEIPSELQRVVEFLNEQMDPAEVLAVAVRHYRGEGLRTLVPQVLGMTSAAEARKGARRPGREWDEESFFEALRKNSGDAAWRGGRRLYRWAQEHLPQISWGRGAVYGSCLPASKATGSPDILALWTSGTLELRFWNARKKPPFDEEAGLGELGRRVRDIPGASMPEDFHHRDAIVPLAAFEDDTTWNPFIAVMDWYLKSLTAAESEIGQGSEKAKGDQA